MLSFIFLLSAAFAQEKIYIDVGQAQVRQSVLALPPLKSQGSVSGVGNDIFKVISNDLEATGLFQILKPEAFLEDTAATGLKPAPGEPGGFDFAKWKPQQTDFLIRGGYKVDGAKLTLEMYIYYVPQAKLLLGRTYEGQVDIARKMAHTYANDVLKALTGKQGMFLTRIAVSSDRADKKTKEIFVMDWDGENIKQISQHQSIAISPAWSEDSTKVAYTAFAFHKSAQVRNADVFVYELLTGKRFLVSYKKGINSGACFAPGNTDIFLTISTEGTPDIYRMSLDGKSSTSITKGPNGAMNVEPAVSPDGKKLAFSSDRSGKPMIYTMDSDGKNAKRITFGGKYNSTPTWSPDGKVLAFAGYEKDHFDIFTINVDGTGLKRLTEATRIDTKKPATNEDPTFSPDGRHVMFISDRTGTKQLWIVNSDGSNERRITTDKFNYFKPKWSNFP